MFDSESGIIILKNQPRAGFLLSNVMSGLFVSAPPMELLLHGYLNDVP
ncbi:MAG: hypothetical protein XXXJIFNMEKO3_02646 [Candidatus Erwinia impunctatus]|nr:hypothetical protein XXXJIFNMEKO_02646 [Culicoides impunctatus]